MERETGFGPATPAMARQCSTAELLPRNAFGKNFRRHCEIVLHSTNHVNPEVPIF